MIYPSNFEQKIGFDLVRRQASLHCSSDGAREKLLREGYTASADVVERRLALCDELRTILLMESGFPSGEWPDMEAVVLKVRVEGGSLSIEDLMLLRDGLGAAGDILRFFAPKDAALYPAMRRLFKGIDPYPALTNHINTLIDRYGNIRDNASAELYAIRKSIRQAEGSMAGKLSRILAEAQRDGIVDTDASLSIRDGRAAIPVSASNKRRIKGFVIDESATGKTVYIEPVEIVELNNRLRELEYEQKREITRILALFADSIRPDADGLLQVADILTTVDMIRAKARFAIDNNCVKPIVSHDMTLELRSARHPLLVRTLAREGKPVVPLDMKLDGRARILVISGPNAGGKSVCLKTVGLLQYMFQCGFPVPLLENSQLPLFDSIFIDIGDEQSIENDLSTYSSHLRNMKAILANATSRSLVLIDEFGSGTEPVMGGAIAEAILEKIRDRGTFGVITTHYSNLKHYAADAKGIVNGAMTFDAANIAPLFRLDMGIPGSSFTIEIARKTGLPEEIIALASELAGSGHIDMERQLREIARDRRYWEQKRNRIRLTDRRVEQLENEYAGLLESIKEERRSILRDARQEAKRITEEANGRIESTIRSIKESLAGREQTRAARRELDAFKTGLSMPEDDDASDIDLRMERVIEYRRRREERTGRRAERPAGVEVPKKPALEEGSKVRIEPQPTIGVVQSVKGKKAVVAFGNILTTVDAERLEVVPNSEYREQQRRSAPLSKVDVDIAKRKLNFSPDIDLRGLRASEALEQVEDFVDDAIMMGVNTVAILHGKGTGALKEEIRRYLRTVDEVESATDEHADRGGAGITVVTFRS